MTTDTLQIGRKAPDFSLLDQDGKTLGLRDLAGRWTVLYFYPKDDTPGCTTEACEFTSDLKEFEKLNARVVGVSPDSPESHQSFIRKYKLKLELLSDPDHTALVEYGAWGVKSMYGRTHEGVIRSTVLIDPQGMIAAHWSNVQADGHAEDVRKKLVELTGG